MFSRIGAHTRLLAPLAIVIAFATITVSPAQALWSDVATPHVTVEAVGNAPTQVSGTSVATSTAKTPGPEATTEPCKPQALEEIHFSGHFSLTGEGPFDATLHLTNDGDETAHDVIVLLTATSGWEFLERVDFANTQYWLIEGDAANAATLYGIGDLDPGDTADIEMHIQMTDDWIDADPNAKAQIAAAVFDDCEDLGNTTKIRLHRTIPEDETPSPELTQTREPHRTVTKTSVPTTGTPVEEVTETPIDQATETPTPVATDTATATATQTTVGVTHVSTATPTSVATKPATTKTASPVSTTLAAAATPGPNHVLGTDALPPPAGQALPSTGSGLPGPTGSRAFATLVLIAVAAGFVTIAVGVGRRLT